VLKDKPEKYFRKEAAKLGMSLRAYCRKFGISYASIIGKEVGYGEPSVPLSSFDQRELDVVLFKRGSINKK
jgi:hypothetical protein